MGWEKNNKHKSILHHATKNKNIKAKNNERFQMVLQIISEIN